jgi:hypothetical protein
MSCEPKVGKNLALFCFAHFSQRPSISSKNGFYQKRSILGLRPEALPVIQYFALFGNCPPFSPNATLIFFCLRLLPYSSPGFSFLAFYF